MFAATSASARSLLLIAIRNKPENHKVSPHDFSLSPMAHFDIERRLVTGHVMAGVLRITSPIQSCGRSTGSFAHLPPRPITVIDVCLPLPLPGDHHFPRAASADDATPTTCSSGAISQFPPTPLYANATSVLCVHVYVATKATDRLPQSHSYLRSRYG